MSSYEKMKQKILQTPARKDIMPTELQNFLEKYGFKLMRIRGDHFIFKIQTEFLTKSLIIPMASPIKPVYINQLREIIIEVEEL